MAAVRVKQPENLKTLKSGKAIKIGVANQKGGVGKSTTVTAMGTLLGLWGFKVLIVDCDPQGNSSLQFGVDTGEWLELAETQELDSPRPTVSNVFLKEVTAKDAVMGTGVSGVDIIPAGIDLAEVEMQLPGAHDRDLRLLKGLESVKDEYDFIIFDAPPNLGALVCNIIVAADYLIIPISGAWSLRSVKALLRVAQDVSGHLNLPQWQMLGLLHTRVAKNAISTLINHAAHQTYQDQMFETFIKESSWVQQAEALSMPIPVFKAKSAVTDDYAAFTEEVLDRLKINIPTKK